jgi:3-hydroxyisobutyrate dehydrogenase
MGKTGSGQATKAVNQVMAAGINQAVSEALAFGNALGLDMDKLIDVIGGGAASNWFLANRGANMAKGIFEPGFKVSLHHKDLELCRNMAEKLTQGDNRLPIIEMTLIHYRRLMEAGFGEEDISSLYRHKQKLFENE